MRFQAQPVRPNPSFEVPDRISDKDEDNVTVHRPPIRVAVLGAGAIAQVVHLPILSRMRGVEIETTLRKHDVGKLLTTIEIVSELARFPSEAVKVTLG